LRRWYIFSWIYTTRGNTFLSLLAILSDAQGYEDIPLWMKERKRELTKFLGINAQAVEKMQQKWIHKLSDNSDNVESLTIVASDGKTMKGSKSKEMNEKARHIISLFLTEKKLCVRLLSVVMIMLHKLKLTKKNF